MRFDVVMELLDANRRMLARHAGPTQVQDEGMLVKRVPISGTNDDLRSVLDGMK